MFIVGMGGAVNGRKIAYRGVAASTCITHWAVWNRFVEIPEHTKTPEHTNNQ